MKNFTLMSLVFGFLLSAGSSFANGLDGCYQATSTSGRKYDLKMKSVHVDADIGTIYDLAIRLNGNELIHKHGLLSYSDDGCFFQFPHEIKVDTDHGFYFDMYIDSFKAGNVTQAQCNSSDFDLTQAAPEGVELEISAGNTTTRQASVEDSVTVENPVPQECTW